LAIWGINSRSLGYDYPEDSTRARLARVLEMGDHALFVFGEPAAGYVHIQAYDCTYADALANILALAVFPEAQGRGAGRALMEEAENWAKARGIAGIRLDSGMDRVGAHAFYQAIGYRLRKDHRNFVKSFSDD
jgi:ribosomal protein S18 acetylase RimI-like enzyme